MPLVPSAIERRTTNFNTTSVAFVTVNTLASTNFVVGRKYLLLVQAQWAGASSGDSYALRVQHGSTTFPTSDAEWEPSGVTPNRLPYGYFTVWEAVASESIVLQVASIDGTVMNVDTATIVAIEISEELTENTDWFFNEVVSTTALPIFPLFTSSNNASITFTPGNAGDTWLVLTQSIIDAATGTEKYHARLQRTGEATENTPEWIEESENVLEDFLLMFVQKTLTLGAVSNTFENGCSVEGTANGDRLNSAVFAINLSKFVNIIANFVPGAITLDTTNAFATSTEIGTADLNQSSPNIDTLILASFKKSFSEFSGTEPVKVRLQYDDADSPANQTTQDFPQLDGWDVEDKLGWRLVDIQTGQSISVHNADLDATNTTVMTTGERLVIQVELAIQVVNNNNFDVDATTFIPQFQNFDVDAVISQIVNNDFDVDALISTQTLFPFNVDVFITTGQIVFFNVDAFLSVQNTFDFDVDAILNVTFDFVVDAQLLGAQVFLVDAIIRGQLSVPISPDIAVDGWTPTPLFPELDEEPFVPGQQITLSGSGFGQPELFQVTMLPVTDPIFSTGNAGKDHKIRALCRSTMGSLAVQLILFQNVTEVARSPFLRVVPAGVFVTLEYTLTALEADAITDYSALRIRVIPAIVGDPLNTFGVDAVLI